MKPSGQQGACPFCGRIVIHLEGRAEVMHATPVCDEFKKEMQQAGLVAERMVMGVQTDKGEPS